MTNTPTPPAPENEKAMEPTLADSKLLQELFVGAPAKLYENPGEYNARNREYRLVLVRAHVATEVAAATARLEKRVRELEAENKGHHGAWNTLANCADTLRARDFGPELGPIDDRVIAMAKSRDTLTAQCVELTRVLSALVGSSTDEGNVIIANALRRTASDFEGKCVVERADEESLIHDAKMYHWVMERCTEAVNLVEEHVEGYPGRVDESMRSTVERQESDLAALRLELERRETLIAACEIAVKQADTLRMELAEARETGVKSMSMGEAELRKERDGLKDNLAALDKDYGILLKKSDAIEVERDGLLKDREWRDMDSAPKDKTWSLFLLDSGHVRTGYWWPFRRRWDQCSGTPLQNPIAWMPLPIDAAIARADKEGGKS